MDPITIAMGLATLAPKIIGWLAGNKAEEAATAVVSVAQRVAGVDDPAEAAAKLQADPALVLQFRQALAEREADLDKAFLADRKDARARDVTYVQAGRQNYRADLMLALAFAAVIAIAVLLALGKVDGASAIGGFLITVGGMFARNIGTAFDFEFGSSRSSAFKDETIKALSK